MSDSPGHRHLVSEPQLRDLQITVGLYDMADGLVPGFVLGVHPRQHYLGGSRGLKNGRVRRDPRRSVAGAPFHVGVEWAVTNPSGSSPTLYPAGSGNLNLPDVPEPSTFPGGSEVHPPAAASDEEPALTRDSAPSLPQPTDNSEKLLKSRSASADGQLSDLGGRGRAPLHPSDTSLPPVRPQGGLFRAAAGLFAAGAGREARGILSELGFRVDRSAPGVPLVQDRVP